MGIVTEDGSGEWPCGRKRVGGSGNDDPVVQGG